MNALVWPDLQTRFNRLDHVIAEVSTNLGSMEIIKTETVSGFLEVCKEISSEEPLEIFHTHVLYQIFTDLSSEYIQDSQLQRMFAICHPSLTPDAQIGLALRLLCGFGISEVAEAFLVKIETVNKRLYRAKEKLRQNRIKLVFPDESLLNDRLENVIRVIYLLFNEGYYSRSPNENLKKE